jgi:Family of unknown function (DUF1028)
MHSIMTWSLIARDTDGRFGVAIASRFFSVGALCIHTRAATGALCTQALPWFWRSICWEMVCATRWIRVSDKPQNTMPTLKCKRAWRSWWAQARSKRKGPTGLRQRRPTPLPT